MNAIEKQIAIHKWTIEHLTNVTPNGATIFKKVIARHKRDIEKIQNKKQV